MYPNDLPQYRTYNRREYISHRPTSLLDRNVINKESPHVYRNILYSFWSRYVANTSMHGVRYIGQRELHWSERLGWLCLVISAIVTYILVSLQLQQRFSSNLLSTVIESITYPVTEISFPAITVCNANRINWLNIDRAQKKFLPNADNKSLTTFYNLVKTFEIVDRGVFKDFTITPEQITPELEKINLMDLFEFVRKI